MRKSMLAVASHANAVPAGEALSEGHAISALAALAPDAATVFTPLAGEPALLEAGILARPLAAAEAAWRADLTSVLVPVGLPVPPEFPPSPDGRQDHSAAFHWLWTEFTSVRRSEDGATW